MQAKRKAKAVSNAGAIIASQINSAGVTPLRACSESVRSRIQLLSMEILAVSGRGGSSI
jgi:hypothetical protein